MRKDFAWRQQLLHMVLVQLGTERMVRLSPPTLPDVTPSCPYKRPLSLPPVRLVVSPRPAFLLRLAHIRAVTSGAGPPSSNCRLQEARAESRTWSGNHTCALPPPHGCRAPAATASSVKRKQDTNVLFFFFLRPHS